MTLSWYALKHDSRRFQSLKAQIEHLLGIEVYAPKRLTLHKRNDGPYLNKYEVLLFSDYMFLRFDPEVVHTTKVTALGGAYGFVGFGGRPPSIIRQEDIDKIKSSIKRHNDELEDKGAVEIGRDKSDQALYVIVRDHSAAARNAGLYALMQHNDLVARSASGVRKNRLLKNPKLVLFF